MKRRTSFAKLAAAAGATALLTTALLALPPASPAQAQAPSFPDVADTNPAHDAIVSLASRGILAGDANGNFNPNAQLTRGQAAKIIDIWRGVLPESEPASAVSAPFTDLDPLYQAYVSAAYAKGWIGGYPDGTFRPGSSLTREQMAVIAIRSLGLDKAALALTTAQIAQAIKPFSDRGIISDSALPYLAFAINQGLLVGDSGTIDPLSSVTKAQFAMVLARADALPATQATGAVAAGATPAGGTGADGTGASGTVGGGSGAGGAAVSSSPSLNGAANTDPVLTPDEQKLADFMDTYLFHPHNSPITGLMVIENSHWYGIPALSQLVIMTAETSLGDPVAGGTLARRNNFGCLRYNGTSSPWGSLSDGSIWVAGKDWYSFPSPQAGMAAFGRYLKSGVSGFYVPILTATSPDWQRFANVYYGQGVPGLGTYVSNLNAIARRYRTLAAQHGVSL